MGRRVRKNRGRSALAVAQIALAVVLLVGAGLLLRSFLCGVSVPLGFQPEGVLGVELPWSVHRRRGRTAGAPACAPGVWLRAPPRLSRRIPLARVRQLP